MREKITQIRAYPKNKSVKADLLICVGVILLGAVLGLVAKAADSVSITGEIGTELGIWVFVATLVAVFSRYPFTAAINTMLFFISMLGAYYLYGYRVFGFFPQTYFAGWLVVALLSPIAGFVVWFAKGKGIFGAIVTALPASILFAWGYSAFYTRNLVSALTIGFGIVLAAWFPKTLRLKGLAFCVAVLLAFLIRVFNLLRFLPF